MRIAITGASGLIGRAVVAMALAQGHRVVAIDRVPPPAGSARPDVVFVRADVARYDEFEQALRGCDALVHLAAIPTPDQDPDYVVHNNNVAGSYNALSAAVRLGMRHICQASSVNAIGATFSRWPRYDYFPLDERHPTYNEDAYSLSKWLCEQQADSFARLHSDLCIASLRFHWVVPDRATAVHGEFGPRELAKQLWGYVSLDAVARACLLSLTAGYSGHEAFLIVAPDTMMDVPSLDLRREFFPEVPVRGDLSGKRGFYDTGKAERLLNWRHEPHAG